MTGRRAFSLVEVMVSGTIFIVGLVGAFSAFNVAGNLAAHAAHRATAINLTEAMLEELIQRYPTDPALHLGDHGASPAEQRVFNAEAHRVDPASTDAVYRVTWQVVPFRNHAGIDAVPGVREIVATCAWREAGKPQSLVLRTWRL
jgi:Tfp pilus assembly protein PilV